MEIYRARRVRDAAADLPALGGDYAARYNGEEFARLPGTTVAQAPAVLARLRQHRAVLHAEVTFCTGLSLRGQHRDGDSALGDADRALYAAKTVGRDRNCVDV